MRWIVGLATALLLAAAPAFAQYEVVQGFDDLPPKGPGTALGIVIWNHGLHGEQDKGEDPPPAYVRKLHAAGWDVVRIKRDALYEKGGWTAAGLRHVARTIEEAKRAKEAGYARIVLAGQSYGGAITLEAARQFSVYAVIPSSPTTGVQRDGSGALLSSTAGPGTAHLYAALADGKFERAVVVLPFSDGHSLPNPERGRRAREILAQRGVPFLPLDSQATILVGHSASATPAMTALYGDCLVKFLDPSVPRSGRAQCGADGLPGGIDILGDIAALKPATMPASEWWKPYEGVWIGAWGDPALIALALEKSADGYELVYLYGAKNGSEPLPMGAAVRRAPAKLDGQNVVADFPTQKVTLQRDRDSRQVMLRWTNPQGRSGSQLLRPYSPREPGS